MKKITIIPLIIILLLIFSSYIYALDSSIDMNLTAPTAQNSTDVSDNTDTSDNTGASTTNDTNATADTNSAASADTAVTSPTVTSTSSSSDQGLFSSSNILNIILITIGIVLILLGVAIFIRTK